MKSIQFAAFVAATLLLSACPQVDPSDGPDPDSTNNSITSSNNNTTAPNNGAPDAGGSADTGVGPDTSVEFGEIPEAIDSSGARFQGRLAPGDRILLDLTVFQADRATLWLRQINDTNWDASVSVFRKGDSEPLAWGNPDGNEDASIPFRSGELESGFEFWYSGTYDLMLQNRGETPGDFEFTLDCKGGPCAIRSGDGDLDGIEDSNDDCPYNPGDCASDPWSGESNGTLEASIRSSHRGHQTLNYVEARVHMFAWIDNDGGEVEGVYTGTRVSTEEIPEPNVMNTEHTWPQSRSGGDPATESDLHQLFPTVPLANEERGSLNFGIVSNPYWQDGGSKAGDDSTGNAKFEPRDEHKGAVARAMFYYAVVYNQDIPSWEEDVLRDWNESFPVTETERRRNQAIEHTQGSRNPFVDYPPLADRISDF